MYTKGFKFKPTFNSNIDFFEFDHFDESTNMVHTIVHPINGQPFADSIEKPYYEAAFITSEYVALK